MLAMSVFIIILMAISAYGLQQFQPTLELHFATEDRLRDFRSLILTVGGALLGAAAIAFSLVMFALQVNVERMPHGLFRKLSTDRLLFGVFGATFVIAIVIATLSMVPDKSWLAIAVFGAIWGTASIVFLFRCAYGRALSLISPMKQLEYVLETARKDLRRWSQRAQRASPLIALPSEDDPPLPDQSTFDTTRLAYLGLFPNWTSEALRAVRYANSSVQRYSEQGDYEVSSAGLRALIEINAAYIEAKGKTFVAEHFMFENPHARDQFINDTLEHLRQNLQISVSRRDERQIEQTLTTMASLVRLYLGIDYSNQHASKTHANLAAAYLTGAADSIFPLNMTDVLMKWMCLTGDAALHIISNAKPNDIVPLTDKIALIAGACVVSKDHRPASLVGVEQLAKLTLFLLRSGDSDPHFALGKLKSNVAFVAKMILELPDAPLSNVHSAQLAPYYSGTSTETLLQWLTDLTNALSDAPADNEQARRVIRNIEDWSQELYRTEKELFLLAIEKESHFTIDMIHWIGLVTKILVALSNAPACDDHTRDDLRRSALSLISVLDWVPDDNATVAFIGNFSLTETLFEAAFDAHERDCEEVSLSIGNTLMTWGFKAALHDDNWGTLNKAICALATLAIVRGGEENCRQLRVAIQTRLAGDNRPEQEHLNRVARDIRDKVVSIRWQEHSLSPIDQVMRATDIDRLEPLLNDLADILSLGAPGENVGNPDV